MWIRIIVIETREERRAIQTALNAAADRSCQRRAVSNRGLLETLVVSENLDSIGDLERPIDWLRRRRHTFDKQGATLDLNRPKACCCSACRAAEESARESGGRRMETSTAAP